jgi:hypothetical protein
MALKPDRDPLVWDISHFFTALTYAGTSAGRGGIVVATGSASGAAMDQSANACWYIGDPTAATAGKPLGMLMADVVNIDLTRQVLNPNKSEAQLNDKVPLMQKGWAVTNMVDDGSTISPGDVCYLAQSGYVTSVSGYPTAATGLRPTVGKFLSSKDEDGYVKVYIDL